MEEGILHFVFVLVLLVASRSEETIVVYHEYEPQFENVKLRNQNSGDAQGDSYFVVRGFILPVECSSNETKRDCTNPEQEDERNLVSQHIVQVLNGYSTYAECNVHGARYSCECYDKDNRRILCNESAVGRTNLSERYSSSSGISDFTWWRYNLAIKLQGYWYSTLSRGECPGERDRRCAWRLVRTVRTIRSACLKDAIARVVEEYNRSAFVQCPPNNNIEDSGKRKTTIGGERDIDYNQSTVCYSRAFMATFLGQNGGDGPIVPTDGIPNDKIEAAWATAFSDEGCPEVSS